MLSLALHLWLVLAATGVALALRSGQPLAGASVPFAVGALGTGMLARPLPLPVAALGAVALSALAGAVLAGLLSRVDVVGAVTIGLALAFLVERSLSLFPLGARGATDVALPHAPRLVSPSLGTTWDLTPTTLAVTALVAVIAVTTALHRLLAGPAGAELEILRTAPDLAESLGLRTGLHVGITVTGAGLLLGLAGAGTEVTAGVVGPADVGVLLALQLLATGLAAWALTASWWGPGAAVGALWLAEQVLSDRVAIGVVLAVVALAASRRHEPLDSLPPGGLPDLVEPVGLRVEELTVTYGAEPALSAVSFDVGAGQVHALVGANGSGKTTLLRAVCGAARVPSGRLLLGEVELSGGSAARVRAGVVRTLQHRESDADARVAARVREPPGTLLRQALGAPPAAATATGAGPRSLRRAVATGAGVLLLDEPAAGTDALEQAELVAAIRTLSAQGRTVLLVEHDLELVARIASHTTVLDLGCVIASGPTGEVLARPEVRRAFSGVSE